LRILFSENQGGLPRKAAMNQKKGYLTSRHERTGRRERRVYDITEQGRTALADAKTKVKELFGELVEGG
ncbi:hypothetical protein DRM94_21650, partial [Aeromonas taiwanensis]